MASHSTAIWETNSSLITFFAVLFWFPQKKKTCLTLYEEELARVEQIFGRDLKLENPANMLHEYAGLLESHYGQLIL